MTAYLIMAGMLGWIIVSEILHRIERTKLLNRIMAKDYTEYEFYDKQYKPELNEVNKLRKAVRTAKPMVDGGSDMNPAEKQFMGSLEEDWAETEIDSKRLREIVEIENEANLEQEEEKS